MASFVNVVQAGSLPLWNPYLAFGRPLLADPGYQVLYPWTWVYLFVSLPLGYALYSWLHIALCGLGVRKLAHLAGLSPLGAFGAGSAALLSGPLLSYVNLTFQLAGAAWLPWTVAAALQVWRKADRPSVLRLALVLSMQVLAGSGEMIVAAGTVIGAGAVVGCVRRGFFLGRRGLAALGLAGLLGGALSAVQWAPTIALVHSSNRQVLDDHARGAWALHPARLVELAIPSVLSDAPLRPAVRDALFNGREPLLNSIHIGGVVLALGLLAAIRGGGLVHAAIGAAAVFTFAALGPNTPLWPLLSVGPLSPFRFPEKWMLPAALALALMCGAGLDTLRAPWTDVQRRRARTLVAVLAMAGVFVAATALTPVGANLWLRIADGGLEAARSRLLAPVAAFALIVMLISWRTARPDLSARSPVIAMALTLVTLLPVARDVNRSTPAAVLSFVPRAAQMVGPSGVNRLQSSPPAEPFIRGMLAVKGLDIEPVAALARMETLSSPVSAAWAIDGAYDADVTGLGLPEHTMLVSAALQFTGSPLAERLLRLGAVTHVLTADGAQFPGFHSLATVPWLGDNPLVLLAVPAPRPRVFIVHQTRDAASPREAITLLGDPTFDLARETLIVGGPAMTGANTGSTCAVVRRVPDSLELSCTLPEEGVVVVADAWDAGWRATVDGTPTPVLRADVLFRGVRVAAGTHNVRLRYRPPGVILGALLTLTGALVWAALFLSDRRFRGAAR